MNIPAPIGIHRLTTAALAQPGQTSEVTEALEQHQSRQAGLTASELADLRRYGAQLGADIESAQSMIVERTNPLKPFIDNAKKQAVEAREMTPVKAAQILLRNFDKLDGASDGRKNNLVHTRDLRAVSQSDRFEDELRRAARYVLDNPELLKALDVANGDDTRVDNRFGRKDFEKYIEANRRPEARPLGPALPTPIDRRFRIAADSNSLDSTVTDAPSPTPEAQAALDKAGSLVGKHEVADRDEIQAVTKIDPSKEKWCAAFAMNILEEAGVLSLDGLENRNYTPAIVTWAKQKGLWAEPGSYQPRPGDAILFDWDGDGQANHVGIVEKLENGCVCTIEGNTGNSVGRKSYELTSSYILGYVVGGKKPA